MSVSIDRVYQTVLTIVNKEGVAYIMPQEFNLYANQAQIEIFEKYFYDEYRDNIKPPVKGHYTSENITEKLAIFNREDNLVETYFKSGVWKFEAPSTTFTVGATSEQLDTASSTDVWTLGSAFNSISANNIKLFTDAAGANEYFGDYEVYTIGSTKYIFSSTDIEDLYAFNITQGATKHVPYKLIGLYNNGINIAEVDREKISFLLRSPLTTPSASQPVYYRVNETDGDLSDVKIYPNTVNGVSAYYIRKPIDPNWAVDDADKVDFELHPSEFPELVIKILAYVGVTINRGDIAQFAQGEEVKIANTQQ